MGPGLARGIDRTQALAALRLGRYRRIVDQRVQFAVVEAIFDFGDRRVSAAGIRQVDLDVILRPHLPWAVFRKSMARPHLLAPRSEEHTSELHSPDHLVCR